MHRGVSKPVSLSLCLSVQRRVCSAQGHPRSPRLSLQADGVHRDVSKPVSLSVSLSSVVSALLKDIHVHLGCLYKLTECIAMSLSPSLSVSVQRRVCSAQGHPRSPRLSLQADGVHRDVSKPVSLSVSVQRRVRSAQGHPRSPRLSLQADGVHRDVSKPVSLCVSVQRHVRSAQGHPRSPRLSLQADGVHRDVSKPVSLSVSLSSVVSALLKDIHVHLGCLYKLTECIAMSLSPSLSVSLSSVVSALLKDIHIHLGCLYKLTECIAMSLSPSLSLCLSVQRRVYSAQGHPRSPRLSLQADGVHRGVSKPVSLSLSLSSVVSALLKDIHVHLGCLYKLTECIAVSLSPSLSLCVSLSSVVSALLKDIHVHLGCLYKLTECIAMSLSPSLSLCLSVQRRVCSAQGHPRSPRLSLQADGVHRDVSKPVSLSVSLCPASCLLCSRTSTFTSAVSTS